MMVYVGVGVRLLREARDRPPGREGGAVV
jgi:hypothetical protein